MESLSQTRFNRWWGECQQNCEFYSPWGAGMEISAKEFGMGVNLHGALFWGKVKTLLGEGDGLAVRTFSREFSQSGISHFRLSIEYDCIRWRHISPNIYRNNLEFPSDSSPIFYPQITLELLPTTLAIPIPASNLPLHRTWPGSAPAQLTSGGSLKAGVARCECTVESVAHFCAHIARWGREMMGDRRRLLSLSGTRGKNVKKNAESDLSLVVLV